jgi:hypothetical protein
VATKQTLAYVKTIKDCLYGIKNINQNACKSVCMASETHEILVCVKPMETGVRNSRVCRTEWYLKHVEILIKIRSLYPLMQITTIWTTFWCVQSDRDLHKIHNFYQWLTGMNNANCDLLINSINDILSMTYLISFINDLLEWSTVTYFTILSITHWSGHADHNPIYADCDLSHDLLEWSCWLGPNLT